MSKLHFDLKRVKQTFANGPGAMSLFLHSADSGHSAIHCTDSQGKEYTFYIPPHQISIRRCSVTNVMHILTKVRENPSEDQEYWLVSCALNRVCYLFPKEAFTEEGEYQPLEKDNIVQTVP